MSGAARNEKYPPYTKINGKWKKRMHGLISKSTGGPLYVLVDESKVPEEFILAEANGEKGDGVSSAASTSTSAASFRTPATAATSSSTPAASSSTSPFTPGTSRQQGKQSLKKALGGDGQYRIKAAKSSTGPPRQRPTKRGYPDPSTSPPDPSTSPPAPMRGINKPTLTAMRRQIEFFALQNEFKHVTAPNFEKRTQGCEALFSATSQILKEQSTSAPEVVSEEWTRGKVIEGATANASKPTLQQWLAILSSINQTNFNELEGTFAELFIPPTAADPNRTPYLNTDGRCVYCTAHESAEEHATTQECPHRECACPLCYTLDRLRPSPA